MDYKKSIILISAVIIIILLGVFVIRPAITGYSIYQQAKSSNYSVEDYGKNINELESKLSVTNTSLISCEEAKQNLIVKSESLTGDLSMCNSELGSVKTEFDSAKTQHAEEIANLNVELDEKETEIDDLNEQYDTLAKNLANNLCCKAKVDNININYYAVEDDKILCLEEGELEISCY